MKSETVWSILLVFGLVGLIYIVWDVKITGYKPKTAKQKCFERGGVQYIQAQYESDSMCVFERSK